MTFDTQTKFTLAVLDSSYMEKHGNVIIKADDTVVYTSPSITKTTEPFATPEIAINNCSLLTIEYNANSDRNDCIIADAVVYN